MWLTGNQKLTHPGIGNHIRGSGLSSGPTKRLPGYVKGFKIDRLCAANSKRFLSLGRFYRRANPEAHSSPQWISTGPSDVYEHLISNQGFARMQCSLRLFSVSELLSFLTVLPLRLLWQNFQQHNTQLKRGRLTRPKHHQLKAALLRLQPSLAFAKQGSF